MQHHCHTDLALEGNPYQAAQAAESVAAGSYSLAFKGSIRVANIYEGGRASRLRHVLASRREAGARAHTSAQHAHHP